MRVRNKEHLFSHGNIEGRKIVADLLDAGLDALDPYVRGKELIEIKDNKIILHTDGFEMKEDPHKGSVTFDLMIMTGYSLSAPQRAFSVRLALWKRF